MAGLILVFLASSQKLKPHGINHHHGIILGLLVIFEITCEAQVGIP